MPRPGRHNISDPRQRCHGAGGVGEIEVGVDVHRQGDGRVGHRWSAADGVVAKALSPLVTSWQVRVLPLWRCALSNRAYVTLARYHNLLQIQNMRLT